MDIYLTIFLKIFLLHLFEREREYVHGVGWGWPDQQAGVRERQRGRSSPWGSSDDLEINQLGHPGAPTIFYTFKIF